MAAVLEADSGIEHYVRDDQRVVILRDGVVAATIPRPRMPAKDRLARMDSADISVQVLSLSALLPQKDRVHLVRELNDIFVSQAGEAPTRFRVFARLPVPDIDAAVREYQRVRGQPHVVGVVLGTTIDCMQLDSPQFDPMWQLFSDQGTLVFVHPTTACHRDDLREYALSMAVDNLAQTTLAISRLVYSGVLVRFPGIRWLFAHLGGVLPFLIHRLDNYHQQFSDNRRQSSALPSEILKGVYFDTVSTHPPAIRCAFETFPVSQFVFGTDFPHVPGGMERFTQALRDSGLGPEDLAQVEWKTAARLLGLDTP